MTAAETAAVTRVGWVLNLDAELELAQPSRIGPSAKQKAVTARQGARFLRLANATAPPGYRHVALQRDRPLERVVAWCPTPSAVRELEVAGYEPRSVPELEVLQAVNHRGFTQALAPGLPGATFVRSMAAFENHLANQPTPPGGWLLKRAFGFSGRWRKLVTPPLTAAERRWCEASMTEYGRGLQVEPRVEIIEEFAHHGHLDPGGTLLAGAPTRLHCAPDGRWMANELLGDRELVERLGSEPNAALRQAFRRVAEALIQAGYTGPFSVDSFTWRNAAGIRHLQPLSELNARFTMGYFVGMAHHQEVLIRQFGGTAKSQLRRPGT